MDKRETISRLEKASLDIKLHLARLCSQTMIHIGGDLSVADVMTALWQYKMNYDPADPKREDRDRFVLSKGHAAAVCSFNQAAVGCYDPEDIYNEYAQDNGRFAMHSCNLINPHVEVSTGSLGHGFPVSGGIATALKLKGNTTSRVYVVMGDGEHSEGSMWEAVMNASQMKLGNLVGIIDNNKLCFDGTLDQISGIGDLAEKYRTFGWNVREIDGHNMEEIITALDTLPPPDSNRPTVIIAHTVKGKGVSFMEDDIHWHAGKLGDDTYDAVIQQLKINFAKKERQLI